MVKNLSLHNLKISLVTQNKDILRLICRNFSFPQILPQISAKRKIKFYIHQLDYAKIPLSPRDCFRQFPIFQNQYLYGGKANLDFGIRNIKIIVDAENDSIEVYVAKLHGLTDDFLFDIIFFQPLKYLLKFHNLFIQHAAAVAKGKKAVLVCGESGCGKTALSFTLVKNGYKYLSDDDIILKSNPAGIESWSIPTRPKLQEKLIKYFPQIKPAWLAKATKQNKRLLDIEKMFPSCFQERAIPRIIIFPKYGKSDKINIKPLNKREALLRLMREDFTIFNKNQNVSRRHFGVLARLVGQCGIYTLCYNDKRLKEVPAVIDALLKGR
ncbi:MAG: hypothetical protein Q8N14_06455 [Candidatus Omnitrophota bacterium]|nr:hypothetical protein [Candidatus Omnitrophota bacterium]